MKVSTVIPLYNKAPYIERAIRSIFQQTYPVYEIIVIDDGSTDGGGELVKKIKDPRIRFIEQENRGVSATRNRGIEEARGDLIAFLDADDAWKPNFLGAIRRLREKYPLAGAYATAYDRVTPHGIYYFNLNKIEILPPGEQDGLIPNYFKAAIFGPIWTSAVVITKNVFGAIGGFRECSIRAEDVDMWLRIALHYPIAWTVESGATYFQDTTFRSINAKWTTEEPKICGTARRAINSGMVSGENIENLKEYISRYYLRIAKRCLILKEKQKALYYLYQIKDTITLHNKFRWYYLTATLPGNTQLILWNMENNLKKLFPSLFYFRNKIMLKQYLVDNK